ncbi:venom acid phosphatase Acph-1 isoform X2 [Agrilus planipennis]|nr:venom acid phosphatase Acph-1 isoform X2 [Agrilus planipennis]
MIVGAVAVTILITISVINARVINDDPKELQLLHVIYRHGPRTPADTYPNDPYINETFYPVGWGQITNPGKVQMYELGKWLRERYGNFLGSLYNPSEFYVQTTDVDRTKVTAQLINAGLWPPNSVQKWGPLDWQPIPVHSEPLHLDHLLLVRKPCAQYSLELERLEKSDEIQLMLNEYKDLFNNLTAITGKNVKTFDDVQDIYSTLIAEEHFNLTLPEWTKDYFPDKMVPPTVFSYVLNAYNTKLQRLKGDILKKLHRCSSTPINYTRL